MPNPLSTVNPSANVIIGNAGDRPLARHAELAVLAAEAIASWANVEGFMLRLFVEMLGGNKSLATNIYLALENQAAKNAAINAAAEAVLGVESCKYSVFKVIMSVAKTNEKQRNKLVHWTWGDTPNIPNCLLLINPRVTLENLDRADIYVYKKADFESIISANDNLCGYLQAIKLILINHVASSDILRGLLSDSEIASRLNQ